MAKEPGFSGMHKMKPFCFGNIEKKRITESRAMECNRKTQRASSFNCNRNITDGDGQESYSDKTRKCTSPADRKVLLAKWKEERELLKNKLKEKQKPLFKVGIVHHNIASPVFRDISNEKSITKDRNVVKTLLKKRNDSTTKLKKNVAEPSTSKNNDKVIFNKTTLGTGNALVKPTVVKNKVSPVNVFPFNKQNYAFSFRPVSNKKLTEPQSPSFMHSRVKRTRMNQKLLPKKPLFLKAKDNEDKDDQLAHRLSDNSSVHEQKSVMSNCNYVREERTDKNSKLLFSTSKGKERDKEQLEDKLSENSSAPELKSSESSCNRIHELNITEQVKLLSSNVVPTENEINFYKAKSEEIKKESNEANKNKENENTLLVKDAKHVEYTLGSDKANGNKENEDTLLLRNTKCIEFAVGSDEANGNKKNENTLVVRGTKHVEYTVGSDDSNALSEENMNVQTNNSRDRSARISAKLENKNSTEVEVTSDENCSDTTNNEHFIISPYITVHRGKKCSRGWRQSFSAGMLDVTDECRVKSPKTLINECSEFHRNQLDQETGRLLSLADEWEKTAFEKAIPSSVADEIAGIVGQTRLLTRDKFQQFHSLIEQFENNDGPVKITKDDLTGFWEMIYLQVEKLNRSYGRLEEMKNNKWQEKEALSIKRKKKVVKTKKPVAKSRFRDFLQEKKMSESKSEISVHTETSELTETSPLSSTCIPTSVPNQIVSSEGVKRYSASYSPAAYAAMNSSFVGKALGHSPAIVVHNAESATPKSILKKKLSHSVTHRKKTVLFGEDLISCDVKSESGSQYEGVRNESSCNDPAATANDQAVITNAPVKTEDVKSAASSSNNDPFISTNNQMSTTNEPAVSAADATVTTTDPSIVGVAANNSLLCSDNPMTSTNLYTPRRSSRLASKFALSSSKVPFDTTNSCMEEIQNSVSAPEKPVKKFFLKPSTLSINPEELIKSNVEKLQKAKNKRATRNKCEQSEVAGDCVTETCDSTFETLINTRRSKRLLVKESDIQHTVTFESGFSERNSSHYRKTPYKKRSKKILLAQLPVDLFWMKSFVVSTIFKSTLTINMVECGLENGGDIERPRPEEITGS